VASYGGGHWSQPAVVRIRSPSITGGLRCKHIDPDAKIECGALLYVLSVADMGLIFHAHASIDEMRQIQQLKNVNKILEFLGAKFPTTPTAKQ
jgi:hypothetical protein